MCYLCKWEDDGQDDPHADEVWGGPNGEYSLTEGRENFKRDWIMYSPERHPNAILQITPIVLEAKKLISSTFDSMPLADQNQQAQLWATVEWNRTMLNQETKRRIREYENAIGSPSES